MTVARHIALCDTKYVAGCQCLILNVGILVIHSGNGTYTYTFFGYFIWVKFIAKHPDIAATVGIASQDTDVWDEARTESSNESDANDSSVLFVTPLLTHPLNQGWKGSRQRFRIGKEVTVVIDKHGYL